MKAERRQELRTNELSQQLDQAGIYIKQNAAAFTALVVVAAVLVGGVLWYMRRQQNQLMAGWTALSQRTSPTDATPPIDIYKDVANDNLDPTLTVQAWLRVAETATTEMVKTKKPDAPADKNWAQIAEDAYNQVAAHPSKDLGALGQAWIGLGLLAEDKADFEKARQWYQKIIDDRRFADSPVRLQAAYRIENMKNWSAPVVFPPPPPPPPVTTTSAPATSQPEIVLPYPSTEVPESIEKLVQEAAKTPTTQPAGP